MKSSILEAANGRARVAPSIALVCVLVAPALLVWAWSRPEPAGPSEMPPLLLDPREVAAQIRADAQLASRAPSGDRAEERRSRYLEINTAEHAGSGGSLARAQQLDAIVRAIAEEHGDDAVAAMRSHDLERLEPALRGELAATERIAELGAFVRMMQRYGLARGERQVAPRIVVRTLFKARWNALHGLELVQGFSAIERQAYWGWLALRGETVPLERRLDALDHYRRAGGAGHLEARAVLLYDEGRLEEARTAFEAAAAHEPSFRLANHARACVR
jgi:hypothetical protein